MVVDPDKQMVTNYTLALDMTQIPIPERLDELTYMLPGADVEGASAWTFLMQLAQRISPLSEITATVPRSVFSVKVARSVTTKAELRRVSSVVRASVSFSVKIRQR